MEVKNFSLPTDRSNLAEVTLSSRYPESGYFINTISEMMVYLLEGKVLFNQEGKEIVLNPGDAVLTEVNKKYFWQPLPEVKLLIFSTPPWTLEQQKTHMSA